MQKLALLPLTLDGVKCRTRRRRWPAPVTFAGAAGGECGRHAVRARRPLNAIRTGRSPRPPRGAQPPAAQFSSVRSPAQPWPPMTDPLVAPDRPGQMRVLSYVMTTLMGRGTGAERASPRGSARGP